MGLGLRRPCIVCQRLTEPGMARCPAHSIHRSPSVRHSARRTLAGRATVPCERCHEDTPSPLIEMDHIIPLWAGGRDAFSNLQALCPDCHALKTLQDLREHRPG